MIKKISFLLVLVLLTSNVVMAYGLGVSPADDTVCVIPGQVKILTYFVSKSNDMTEGFIEIYAENVSWMYVQQYLELPEQGEKTALDVTLYVPKEIEYGLRTGEMMICSPPKITSSGTPIQPCVQSLLHIDVQETCPEIEERKQYFRNLISDVLMAGIFILLLLYLSRRVTRTKSKTKKKVRRIKRRKLAKRSKK
ncbi:MAG: hypothetical protein GOV02_01045 [Candidatus Aenigmarchaeota archaeon]|nr:hypothetical protein [Candidatus Aenigmarchaeota archaeon]